MFIYNHDFIYKFACIFKLARVWLTSLLDGTAAHLVRYIQNPPTQEKTNRTLVGLFKISFAICICVLYTSSINTHTYT